MGAKSSTLDKLPPHSEDAEKGVLGCCLLEPDCIDECQVKFKGAGGAVFYDLRNRKIFETLAAMRAEAAVIDVITVQQRLLDEKALDMVGGLAYLSGLPDEVPSTANLPAYLEIVWEKHLLRKVIRFCAKAVKKLNEHEGDAYGLIGSIQNAFNDLETDSGCTLSATEATHGFIDDLERRVALNGKRSGLVTGLHEWDALTDGLQFGEQTIVAARPSVGKTALACSVVSRVCLTDGVPTVFATFEMSPTAIMRRLFSAHCGVHMSTIKKGLFTEQQHVQFANFVALMKDAPFYVINGLGKMNVVQLGAEVRRLKRKHGIRFIAIDYLQKISPGDRHEKRTYEVGEVSSVLRALAVETNAAMLTLAQLNREPEKDKQKGTSGSGAPGRLPRLSDLADSKQIEQDADCVGLLHRPRGTAVDHEAKLIVAKQRDGEIGIVDLLFRGIYCRFENPPQEANQQQQTGPEYD